MLPRTEVASSYLASAPRRTYTAVTQFSAHYAVINTVAQLHTDWTFCGLYSDLETLHSLNMHFSAGRIFTCVMLLHTCHSTSGRYTSKYFHRCLSLVPWSNHFCKMYSIARRPFTHRLESGLCLWERGVHIAPYAKRQRGVHISLFATATNNHEYLHGEIW